MIIVNEWIQKESKQKKRWKKKSPAGVEFANNVVDT